MAHGAPGEPGADPARAFDTGRPENRSVWPEQCDHEPPAGGPNRCSRCCPCADCWDIRDSDSMAHTGEPGADGTREVGRNLGGISRETAAHTPGPWVIDRAEDGHCSWVQGDNRNYTIGHLVRNVYIPDEVHDANAKLIAQAPNLLAFAQFISDFFDKDSAGHASYLKQQADNAIEAAS